jgi:hypothetical protein
MKKTRDLKRLKSILEYFKMFEDQKIDLLVLTQKLDALTSTLETFDEEWYWAFKGYWAYLEAIYYSAANHGLLVGIYPEGDNIEIKNRIQKMKEEVNLQISKISLHRCPSCGYDISDSALWIDPSLEQDFCDCCGLEFRREKGSLDVIRKYRSDWLQHPMLWQNPKAMPKDWKIEDQMEHISAEYL